MRACNFCCTACQIQVYTIDVNLLKCLSVNTYTRYCFFSTLSNLYQVPAILRLILCYSATCNKYSIEFNGCTT